jgi:hypothetical protein
VKAEKLKSKQKSIYHIMKKVIAFILVLCFIALSVSEAQVNRGRSLLGVSTSFSYVNFGSDLMSLGFTSTSYRGNSPDYVDPSKDKMITLNLLPRFGYFVANNLALGINLCIASSTDKPGGGEKYTATAFGAGPFLRYYISGSKVMPFFEVSSLFGSITSKNVYLGNEYSNSSSMRSIGAGAGIALKVGDKVTFDLLAGYNSMSEKAKENNPNDNRTVQGTLGFKFGFVVLFGTN